MTHYVAHGHQRHANLKAKCIEITICQRNQKHRVQLVVLPAIHEANAKKTHELSASSFTDGYAQGIKDAGRDLKGLNGHGYDSSCPEGHTDVFCNGYKQGYDHEWEAP
jgi:hypothetical protein